MKNFFKPIRLLKNKTTNDETQTAQVSQIHTQYTQKTLYKQRFLHVFFHTAQWIQIKSTPLIRKINWNIIRAIALILAFTFMLASSVSTAIAHIIFTFVTQGRLKASQPIFAASQLTTSNAQEELQVQFLHPKNNAILKRILFNSEGKLPPDPTPAVNISRDATLDFNALPCKFDKIPVEVVGAIYTGDDSGIAILRDPKIPEADTYKKGDTIIDYEEYEVHSIQKNYIEFRYGNEKICVYLPGMQPESGKNQASSSTKRTETVKIKQSEIEEICGTNTENCLINQAKLIPLTDAAGKFIGYQLIGILPNSIYEKLGFQQEDIITIVNNQEITIEQGHLVYSALQQDRNITFVINRKGEIITKNIQIE